MFSKYCFLRIVNSKTQSRVLMMLIKKPYENIVRKGKQEGHDGPEIAHLSLLTKHAPSSFPVT